MKIKIRLLPIAFNQFSEVLNYKITKLFRKKTFWENKIFLEEDMKLDYIEKSES